MKETKKYQDRMVGYKNDYNYVIHSKLNATGLDILNAVLHLLKKQGGKGKISVSLSKLTSLLNTDNHNQHYIEKEAILFSKNISYLIYEYDDSKISGSLNLTSYAKYNKISKILVVKFNEDYEEFFQNLKKQVTYYKLFDYVLIKGKYAKRLYPHLMQFKSTGKFVVNRDELYSMLQVPDSYVKRYLVDPKVIKPAINSLKMLIPTLKVDKVRGGRRHKIIRYVFTFKKVNSTKQINSQDLPF